MPRHRTQGLKGRAEIHCECVRDWENVEGVVCSPMTEIRDPSSDPALRQVRQTGRRYSALRPARVQFELSPCHGFKQLFQSSITAGKCDVGIGQTVHQGFSLMHISCDSHISDAVMHEFGTSEVLRNHADDVAAMSQDGVRKDTHDPGAATAVNECMTAFSENGQAIVCRFSELL